MSVENDASSKMQGLCHWALEVKEIMKISFQMWWWCISYL